MKISTAFGWLNMTKQIIPTRLSYHHSFEKYLKSYLSSFSIEGAEKFDLFSNKNSKYLL